MPDASKDPTFAARPKSARQFRGMTQAELSERSGVPVTSVAHLERGDRKPSLDTFEKLASALEIQSDYLIGRQKMPIEHADDTDFIRRMRELRNDEIEVVENTLP